MENQDGTKGQACRDPYTALKPSGSTVLGGTELKVLRALAAIHDVKDFRVRTLMDQLGMDPSQPVLLYRLLVKEGRLAVSLGDQVRSLEERCRQLEAKCRRIASEKLDAEAQADELLRAAAEKVRSLEAANSVLEERLAGAAQEVAERKPWPKPPTKK